MIKKLKQLPTVYFLRQIGEKNARIKALEKENIELRKRIQWELDKGIGGLRIRKIRIK